LRSLSGHDHSLGWLHEHRRAPWDEQRQPLASVTANAAVGVAAATTPTAVNGTSDLTAEPASGQGLGRLGIDVTPVRWRGEVAALRSPSPPPTVHSRRGYGDVLCSRRGR
jgi:hypothetical protein